MTTYFKNTTLGIPAMIDRAQQALHLLGLEPVAETLADHHSYGFRPERSTADAMEQCFKVLSKADAPKWILEGDIKSCFDQISHTWMLQHIPMDTEVLRKWLQAGYLEAGIRFPTLAGTPQGGIASPTLANMTLDGLAELLNQRFLRKQVEGVRTCPKVKLVRYADDFIITGRTKELLEIEVRPLVEQFLLDRGLRLSPEKTRITHIRTGFDFLGQHLRYFGDKLIIRPSKKNTHAFLEKVRQLVKANASATQSELIGLLNPVIRGWAKRRHPKKGYRWIKKRYFHSIDSSSWVFAVDTGERLESGQIIWQRLVRTRRIPIRRFRKIRAEANPFDPEWYDYFEERAFFKKFGISRHQAGLKPSCSADSV